MGLFDIAYDRLVWQNMPTRLRKPIHYAWLKALAAGVDGIADDFKAKRIYNLYVLAHNGQVCYLEAALNDVFDSEDRGIYISDPNYIDPEYIYRRNELKPLAFYRRSENLPTWTYRRSETARLAVTFVVNVPMTVTYNDARMKALIDFFKLAGRTYKIVPF